MIPASLFVFATAAAYVLHSVLIKYSTGKTDPSAIIFMYGCGAFLVGVIALLYGKASNQLIIYLPGWAIALAAGAAVTAGSFAYALAFQKGADFSFATPLVNISVVMGGLIFGLLLFGEAISLMRILGIVLGVISILLMLRS